MTLFFFLAILILGGALYLCRRNYIRLKKRVIPHRQQLTLFNMREKFINDILNIQELSVPELGRLLKLKEKIARQTRKLPDANRILFDELRLEPTELIIKKAMAARKWEQECKLLLQKEPEPEERPRFFKEAEHLLNTIPPARNTGRLQARLKQKTRHQLHSLLPENVPSSHKNMQGYARRYTRPDPALSSPALATATPAVEHESLPAHKSRQIITCSDLAQLSRLQKLSWSVAFVSPPFSAPFQKKEVGTGFLISPRLLLTTYELLPSIKTAENRQIWLGYEDDDQNLPKAGKTVALAPDRFFMSSPKQGFSLVSLAETLHDLPLFPPAGQLDFPPLKTGLTLVHHAFGRAKEILHSPLALQEILGHQFWFSGQPGLQMSGAPVLNEKLEVIGICQGSCLPGENSQDETRLLHHQALRMDRIQYELTSTLHQMSRKDQTFLRDEQAATGFLLGKPAEE